MKPVESKTYLFQDHPFFYVTLTDFSPGVGLMQIHSDWGNYSYLWTAMGQDTLIKDFVVNCDSSYIENKLSHGMHYLGVKKEGYKLLTKFMAHCWPRFVKEFSK